MAPPHIYVLCPENDRPSGGVKILYRHVGVLARNGFSASILHQQRGFRGTWFANSTPIRYLPDVRLAKDDFDDTEKADIVGCWERLYAAPAGLP